MLCCCVSITDSNTIVKKDVTKYVDLAEEEGVSTELQRLISALVVAEWKRLPVKPKLTPEEIAELVSERNGSLIFSNIEEPYIFS